LGGKEKEPAIRGDFTRKREKKVRKVGEKTGEKKFSHKANRKKERELNIARTLKVQSTVGKRVAWLKKEYRGKRAAPR